MAYTQESLASLITEIAVSLQDPNNVYWSTAEISNAISEAMLEWGALSNYWRDRGTFNTVVAQPFYDLSVKLPALRSRTVTIQQLAVEMQYMLLEAANGISGTGMSAQFTIGQLLSALTRARNEFILDSELPLTFNSFPVVAPLTNGRLSLDQSVAVVARAAWTTGSGVITPLRREDPWSAPAYSLTWPTVTKTPIAYSLAETRPIEMQFIAPPSASGTLQLVYAPTITIDTTNPNSTFNVPDEFARALKYHALYEVLSTQGPGYDPLRSRYAYERYRMDVEAAKAMRSMVAVYVNNVPTRLDTLAELDNLNSWQNQTGTPKLAGAVYDILALSKVPNTVIPVTCDLVRSAPLPVLTTDFLQIGSEEMPYIIGEVRHILSFKLCWSDFQSTFALHDTFLAGATQRNKLLAAKTRYLSPLFDTPKKQEAEIAAA